MLLDLKGENTAHLALNDLQSVCISVSKSPSATLGGGGSVIHNARGKKEQFYMSDTERFVRGCNTDIRPFSHTASPLGTYIYTHTHSHLKPDAFPTYN